MRARARASRWRAAPAPPSRAGAVGRPRGGGGMNAATGTTPARRPAARVDRSLRQVHDLRDPCPVSNVTPLFPGPKYVGPQAERYRVAGEPSVEWSVDYCSGCGICSQVVPAGGEDRGGQRPGAQQAQAPEGRPAPRPDHHPPDLARSRRHAGGAAGQLYARFPAVADPRREAARGSPRRGRAGVRRPALLDLGAEAPEPADRKEGRLLPRLRHGVLRAVGGREGHADPRAQRVRGRRAQAGLLRPAAAVERPVRRRPQGRAAAGACARALRP